VPWSNDSELSIRGGRSRMEASRADGDDREIMARLAAGDREALAPLMELHYRRLYRIALAYLRQRDDALDVVQEAFVRAFQAAPRWDGTAAGPWLSRITVNLSIDRWRRNRRRADTFTPLVEGDYAASLADAGPTPDGRVHSRETGEWLQAALGRLPERQRAVVVLRHYQELSLEEIAEALGISLGTVKSSLHRALQRMRLSLARGSRS
jgi:RNA polymerase sigma-70 factor (ECF subfamily)